VAWWAWLLLVWAVLAVVGAVVLGRAIRMADRRDLGQDRPGEARSASPIARTMSPVLGTLRGIPRQQRH
jgi:hypothetical protein